MNSADILLASKKGAALGFFNIDLKKWLFVILALLLPLITINMEQKPVESNWLSRPFLFLNSLMQDGLFEFSSGVKETTSQYINLLNIKKENAQLKAENHELTARLQIHKELELENQRLRQMFEFKQRSKMSLVAAQVIGRDLILDHKTISINKGTQHGLKDGQAVITLLGVVGYIFRAQAMTSSVMLMTDRYAVADGLIQRTRAAGIVEGRGSNSLVMKYVERTEDVQPGDIVVTGGLDNIFPKGFPIARVESVERKAISISLKVDLKPLIDASSLEEVFVVINAAKEEYQSLTSPSNPPSNSLPTHPANLNPLQPAQAGVAK